MTPTDPWSVQARDAELIRLRNEGRLTNAEIAEVLGFSSEDSVRRRVRVLGLPKRVPARRRTPADTNGLVTVWRRGPNRNRCQQPISPEYWTPPALKPARPTPSLAPTPVADRIGREWRFSVADERAGRAVSAKLYALECKRAKAAAKQAGQS